MRARAVPVLLAVGTLLGACSGNNASPPAPVPPGWADSLLSWRERIDTHFRSSESPIDSTDRAGFAGLTYYPPDPTWRFEVKPDRDKVGYPVTLLDTEGQERAYTVHSRLHFRREGQTFRLTVYESVATPGYLYLAFQDGTSGGETYGVGRYLEVVPGPGDRVTVDFNYAKNPYCAYSDRWACPLVPPENVLAIPVRAGEKAYTGSGH